MKKPELVWLIVRLIGVYFLYLTVTSAISLTGNFITIAKTPVSFSDSLGVLFQSVLWITLYGIIGNYLIRDGSHLFTILNREDSANSLEKDLEEVSFNLNNKQNS